MKTILTLSLISLVSLSHAQNLSPDEQRQMLQDMQVMKEKISKLENKSGTAAPSGLKTVNYQNETSEKKENGAPSAGGVPGGPAGSLTPEQAKTLVKDLEALKVKQAEAQKMLDQLEKDESEQYK